MPIESFGNIDDLDPLNPLVDDPVSEGDDHLRGLKLSLQGNVQGDDTFTALLVAGFIAATIDATALTIKAVTLFDMDDNTIDEAVQIAMRNLIGGHRLITTPVFGTLQIDQLASDGTFEQQIMTAVRDGAVTLFNAKTGAAALITTDPLFNNSSADTLDSQGVARPVGYNLLPRVDYIVNHTVTAEDDSGMKLRINAAPVTLTFPGSLPTDFTCVILNTSTGLVTLTSTGGTIRLHSGAGSTDGNATMQGGSVATVSKAGTSTVFECWGNGITN